MLSQREVGAWHKRTFPVCGLARIMRKAEEEFREFKESGDPLEAADVLICLMSYADRAGFDLMDAARRKFAVVSARTDQPERDAARGIS